jgi:cellobiose-specific phosphotransferase system component IIA
MTVAEAEEAVQWATKKKGNAHEYQTRIICVGQ